MGVISGDAGSLDCCSHGIIQGLGFRDHALGFNANVFASTKLAHGIPFRF